MAKKTSARSPDFKSPLGRVSYAFALFKTNDNGKYTPTLIFPKSERKIFEEIIAKVIQEEWPNVGMERAKKGLIKLPLLAGDGKEAHNKTSGELNAGLGPDVFFIRPTANSDHPPRVWYRDPNKQETEAVVYSGCYGKAIMHFFAWHHPESGDMICAGISGFQKLQDGERLGGSGGIDPEKWSETIADEGPTPESAKSGAGASGLFGD